MKDNSASIIIIMYVIIVLLAGIFPFFELIDFESLNNPWDYARITDVDYTAKILDEPDKRW